MAQWTITKLQIFDGGFCTGSSTVKNRWKSFGFVKKRKKRRKKVARQ